MIKKPTVRINIYVDDPELRKNVRLAAALGGTTISEFCLSAIREKLDRAETRLDEGNASMKRAIRTARRFQAKVFGKKVFSVSSAQLIGEARKSRTGK